MTTLWPNLPSWVNEAWKKALIEDRRDLTACLAVGKLIRQKESTPLQRLARQAITTWLEDASTCDELLHALPGYADEAVEAAERTVQLLESGETQMAGGMATLALLRDDLACFDACLATCYFHGPVKQAERLRELDWLVGGYQQAVDRLVEPYCHEMRRIWVESGQSAPPELLAMLSSGANPWWIDIVDPLWKNLKSTGITETSLDLAAANLEEGSEWTWHFERSMTATMVRRHDESLRMTLQGNALQTVCSVCLVWVENGERKSVPFEALRSNSHQAIVPSSIFDSPVAYLLLDGRLVVRD